MARFLLDIQVPTRIVERLVEAGHEVLRAPHAVADEDVVHGCARRHTLLVSVNQSETMRVAYRAGLRDGLGAFALPLIDRMEREARWKLELETADAIAAHAALEPPFLCLLTIDRTNRRLHPPEIVRPA